MTPQPPIRRASARLRWIKRLRFDPLPALVSSGDPAIRHAAARDLLGENPGPAAELWNLPRVQALLRKQKSDGSWPYPGGGVPRYRDFEDYAQIETYRMLGVLVEKFAATRRLPAVGHAAEFLFTRQKDGRRLPRYLRPPVHAQLHRRDPRTPGEGRIRRGSPRAACLRMAAQHSTGRRRLGHPDVDAHAADGTSRRSPYQPSLPTELGRRLTW